MSCDGVLDFASQGTEPPSRLALRFVRVASLRDSTNRRSTNIYAARALCRRYVSCEAAR